MEAAKQLLDLGYNPVIVEKSDHLGGHVSQWHKLFPDMTPAQEIVKSLSDSVSDANIFLETEVSYINRLSNGYNVMLDNGVNLMSRAIIIASGFELFEAAKKEEYGYGVYDRVITNADLESWFNGNPDKRIPSDPKHIGFVHCVGSRDLSERGRTYCSKICCMYNAKHAMYIREKYPNVDVTVFYIDVRTPGKGFDEFQRRAVEEYGVHYVRGQVGKIVTDHNGDMMVFASDINSGEHIVRQADLVVLAAAIVPSKTARKVATMVTASIDTNDFYVEAHPKLRPVESPTAGIFLSGVCQGPRDIPETVAQAGAAAVKAIGLLSKDKLLTNPCTAKCNERICSGCLMCTNVCPYKAISGVKKTVITLDGARVERTVAEVNPALCQGCGACTVACPSTAMDLQGFTNQQIMAEVDALC